MSKDNKHRVNIRRSGLRQYRKLSVTDEIERALIDPQAIEEFQNGYSNIVQDYKRRNQKDAYVIKFIGEPQAFFVTFQTYCKRDTGKWEACKYFHSIGHPRIGLESYNKARRTRVPELDKYRDTEQIPIEELLKLGAAYSCGMCGRHLFKHQDVVNNKCSIIYDEGNINSFTKGIVVCHECRKKYFT